MLDTNVLVRAHARTSTQARSLLKELLERGHRLIISNDILAEVTRVLRNPRFRSLYNLSESELLNYVQFLQSVSDVVILESHYSAPLRDPNDLIVLQTAERGETDILCTHDGDFYEHEVLAYCTARGIEVCDERMLLEWLRQLS